MRHYLTPSRFYGAAPGGDEGALALGNKSAQAGLITRGGSEIARYFARHAINNITIVNAEAGAAA
ncbi:hypothetical protein KCP75_10075 [Salmonella enterica subsp. enterica]|nr:hypothetical protein KCP75_10075 [Salmonella enterica subsp. enterica]